MYVYYFLNIPYSLCSIVLMMSDDVNERCLFLFTESSFLMSTWVIIIHVRFTLSIQIVLCWISSVVSRWCILCHWVSFFCCVEWCWKHIMMKVFWPMITIYTLLFIHVSCLMLDIPSIYSSKSHWFFSSSASYNHIRLIHSNNIALLFFTSNSTMLFVVLVISPLVVMPNTLTSWSTNNWISLFNFRFTVFALSFVKIFFQVFRCEVGSFLYLCLSDKVALHHLFFTIAFFCCIHDICFLIIPIIICTSREEPSFPELPELPSDNSLEPALA